MHPDQLDVVFATAEKASTDLAHNLIEINIKGTHIYRQIMAIPDLPNSHYYDLYTHKIIEKYEKDLIQPSVIEFTSGFGRLYLPDPWCDISIHKFPYHYLYDYNDNVHVILGDLKELVRILHIDSALSGISNPSYSRGSSWVKYHLIIDKLLKVSELWILLPKKNFAGVMFDDYKLFIGLELVDLIYSWLYRAIEKGHCIYGDIDEIKKFLFPLFNDHYHGVKRILDYINNEDFSGRYYRHVSSFDVSSFDVVSMGTPYSESNLWSKGNLWSKELLLRNDFA